MNYFPFHVGDYVASTAHLSWDEDMAYTRLIRVYYQTEKPIPKGQAYRLARATTPAQRAAVDSVLSEFFTTDEADGAFRQSRCDEEICKFNDKQSKAKRSANTRWERAKTHSEGNANASKTHMRTHSEGNANQEPITNNQEPNTETNQSSVKELRAMRGDDEVPKNSAEWIAVFAEQHGVDVDHRSFHDRKKFFPLAAAWTAAGVTIGQMRTACARAFSEAKEPIAWLPAYADRVLASMAQKQEKPPPPEPEWRTEQRTRTAQAVPGIAAKKPGTSRPDFIDVETRNVPSIAMG